MNLYKISQDSNNGYDTYDSMVVVAESEEDARKIHPSSYITHCSNCKWMGTYDDGGEYETESDEWVSFEDIEVVKVEYLGKTDKKRGVVCTSFNAG